MRPEQDLSKTVLDLKINCGTLIVLSSQTSMYIIMYTMLQFSGGGAHPAAWVEESENSACATGRNVPHH